VGKPRKIVLMGTPIQSLYNNYADNIVIYTTHIRYPQFSFEF